MGTAAVKIPAEFRAVDKVTHIAKKMTSGVRRFAKNSSAAMRRFDSRVTRSINGLKRKVGSFGAYIGGAALFGALSAGIGVMADFEEANSNLASILQVNVDQTAKLQANSKKLGATTAFTASQVTGLQTEYAKLGFTEQEILKVTESTLSLAAATKTDLGQAASQVGATLRAFNLDAQHGARVADVFALSTSKSALNMEFLNTAMAIVAPVASKFGFSVEEVTTLLGKLADSGFDASSAATATRNIMLNLADSNGKLAKSLGRPVKDLPSLIAGLDNLNKKGIDLNKALKLTDKRSVAAFATFLGGTKKTLDLNEALEKAGGSAQKMADKQLDNLTGKTTILKSAYEGFILSLDDGSGPYSDTFKNIVMVATEMLSLASGTAKAKSELTGAELEIRNSAETTMSFAKALLYIAAVYKTVSVALGIYSTVKTAYTAVTTAAAAAQTTFAVALWAATWPILAIIAAVAAIIAIFYYWDDITAWFSKQWKRYTEWFGERWNKVVKWFKEFDFKEFFKDIGRSILKFLLAPIQGLLMLLSKLPGKIGKIASLGLEKLGDLTGDVNADVGSEAGPLESPESKNSKIVRETTSRNTIGIDINDPGNNVSGTSNEGPMEIPININKTQGAF